MALIQCPDCGHECSRKAATCPRCGRPLKGQSILNRNVGCGGCVAALVVTVVLLTWIGNLSDTPSKGPKQSSPPQPTQRKSAPKRKPATSAGATDSKSGPESPPTHIEVVAPRAPVKVGRNVVAELKKGECHPILKTKDGWYKVRKDGKEGWVHASAVSPYRAKPRPGIERGSPPKRRRSDSEELKATVRFTGTQFVITNNDAFDWTDLKMEINSGLISSGYVLRVDRMSAGETYTVGALQFAKSDGTRFNPFTTKPQNLSIWADTPHGKCFWYGGWK